jgi:peroxidase
LEPIPILVPKGDPYFDPQGYGNQSMPVYRSVYDNTTGYALGNGTAIPREQINLVTAFLDGSQVYGSDNVTAAALRAFTGGLLATSILNGLELPPLNLNNLSISNDAHIYPLNQLYLLGDVRGNENPALTALHTLFIREHNRRARQLAGLYPSWTDEELYQEARRYVIALIEHITFDEYVPITIGDAADPYTGYNSSLNPAIFTEFSTGAFRYGHSEVSEYIWRVDPTNTTIAQGNLHLRDSYFTSPITIGQVGIEPILRGLAFYTQNAVDLYFIDDIRNYLFGAPGQGGFDLTSINIQRGRDHGLPGINDYRALFGLAPHLTWSDVNQDPVVQQRLAAAYADINDCDVYVCGLAEYHDISANTGNLYGNVGETWATVINDQYDNFRSADRFWYENGQWSDSDLAEIMATTLKDVIVRNTPILSPELQCFVLSAADGCGKPIQPPAPALFSKFDFNITLVKKTPAHPYYGLGHAYGFAVNGVEGAQITLQRGSVYHFWVQIPCAHSFVINAQPEPNITVPGYTPPVITGGGADGDDGGTLPASVANNFACIGIPNRELAIVVNGPVPDYVFYQCDFHLYMGGVIKVVPAPSSAVVLYPAALFLVLLALLV